MAKVNKNLLKIKEYKKRASEIIEELEFHLNECSKIDSFTKDNFERGPLMRIGGKWTWLLNDMAHECCKIMEISNVNAHTTNDRDSHSTK